LNSDNCFILDLGEKVYILQGSKSSANEKYNANQIVNKIKSDRKGFLNVEILAEDEWETNETIKNF